MGISEICPHVLHNIRNPKISCDHRGISQDPKVGTETRDPGKIPLSGPTSGISGMNMSIQRVVGIVDTLVLSWETDLCSYNN